MTSPRPNRVTREHPTRSPTVSHLASVTKTATPTATPTTDDRIALRTWLRLLTCTNLIERRVRAGLRDQFETTLPRFDLLAQLDAAAAESVQGLTMSELSRRLMVTNGNVTGLVDRLVQERLVSRAVSPTDRRTQYVKLTAAGKRALDAMTPSHQRWIDDMFSALSPTERQQLYTLLGKLKDSAQHASQCAEQHAMISEDLR